MAQILGKPASEVLGDIREAKHDARSINDVINTNYDFEIMNSMRLTLDIQMGITSMAQMNSDDPTFAYKRIPT